MWDLQAVIVKSNDDVRQEVFVMQLISFYEEIFKQAGIAIWLRPYKIISTGNSTGLIAVSLSACLVHRQCIMSDFCAFLFLSVI